MSTLSNYLNAHLPDGWQKPNLVEALSGNLDRATVYKYLAGNHPLNPNDSVLAAFATVLPGVSLVELRAAANQPVGAEEPWIPPIEANRLTPPQRRALEALIKTMVAPSTEPPIDFVFAPRTEPGAEPAEQEPTSEDRAALDEYYQQLLVAGRGDLADDVAQHLPGEQRRSTAE